MSDTYFIRESETRFRPTEHVGGAWNPAEWHIAPALGLVTHAIERDFSQRRNDALRLIRLSFDILGTIPLEPVDLELELIRLGRTIELVQATLSHGGRAAVIARAWLSAEYPTEGLAGSALERLPGREQMSRWGLNTNWPGRFVSSVEIWRRELALGRVQFWVRSPIRLLDEPVSDTAQALSVVDVANGVAARVAPEQAAFPNLDLSVHLFRQPTGQWIGLDSSVSFGPSGAGLTHSVLHDEHGPVGSLAQILTVRPR